MNKYIVVSFYHFRPLPPEGLLSLKEELEKLAERNSVKGLIILAAEGLNCGLSGLKADVEGFLDGLIKMSGIGELGLKREDLDVKVNMASKIPFKKFEVRIREEIVTLGRRDLVPGLPEEGSHLDPKDWEAKRSQPDVVVLDTRNSYEWKIGKFPEAICPPIRNFSEFPDFLKNANLPKDKTYLIYCTGGIRCEKAFLEMKEQGFDRVSQLRGGILKYLEEVRDNDFDGECFVFDNRVAVDPNLRPSSKYSFCPHCGQAASVNISCSMCGSAGKICNECASEHQTCSKNCAHHFRRSVRKKNSIQLDQELTHGSQ